MMKIVCPFHFRRFYRATRTTPGSAPGCRFLNELSLSRRRGERGGGILISAFPFLFCKNPASHFLFMSISRIPFPISANPASQEQPNPESRTVCYCGNPGSRKYLTSNAAALFPSPRVPPSRGEGDKAAALEARKYPCRPCLSVQFDILTGWYPVNVLLGSKLSPRFIMRPKNVRDL